VSRLRRHEDRMYMSADNTATRIASPRRVLYFHCRARSHGERLLQILDHLDNTRFVPWVALPGNDMLADELADRDVPVTVTGTRRGERERSNGTLTLPGEVSLGRRIIGKVAPHIVHINSTALEILYAGIAARLSGVPVIWHVPELRQRNERSDTVAKLIRGCAARLAPVSQAAASWLGPPLNGEMVLVPNGVDTDLFAPGRQPSRGIIKELRLAENLPAVGHLGLLAPVKRVKDFVRAAAVVLRSVDAQFIVATDEQTHHTTTVRDLRRLAKELGIGRRVKFAAPDVATAELLPCLDIAVANAVAKSSAGILWQVAACGIPLIAVRFDDVQEKELLEKGCLLTEPGDVDGLAGTILTLMDEPDMALELGSAGRDYVLDRFSATRIVDQIQNMYDDVLNKRPAGRVAVSAPPPHPDHLRPISSTHPSPFGHTAAG
jgi:glycosyltransferase involved in cell wall biosynthesis